SKQATDAERAFLGLLEGGCQVPIGVHAEVTDSLITIEAIIASLDGTVVLRDRITGPVTANISLGRTLGNKMLDNGGRKILDEIF
ncbi:MAG: hydroxymethylbilane synthase, partial [Acidaminococcaceae bacterium]